MSEQQKQESHLHAAPKDIFESMIEVANRHDLEAMVAYFAPDYRGELPFTPERNFTGQAGVRKNWGFFFSTMPDFRAEVQSSVVEGETVWAEMAYYGTQTDGKKQVTRGVSISGIQGEQIAWANLYIVTALEP